MARHILPALAVLALVLTAPATPAVHRTGTLTEIPTDLHAFLLRANEPVNHTFSRTPAFTWKAVNLTGGHYQFQLATSRNFEDATLVFKDANVSQPAETVTRQLPWLTGEPYALWARVRWMSNNGMSATLWSKPFGFNVQWATGGVPQQVASPEGLVRWSPIDGATAYEVLYPDLKPAKSFETTTNVADEREFFTYADKTGYTTIHWRVRAIRTIGQFKSSSNGLPAVSYGPWSPVYSTVNTPEKTGTLTPTDTVSNVWDKAGKPGSAHLLTPGFAWQQSAPEISSAPNLYRVYVFSDKNCVNRIYTGSVVGGPAWAPRGVTDGRVESALGRHRRGRHRQRRRPLGRSIQFRRDLPDHGGDDGCHRDDADRERRSLGFGLALRPFLLDDRAGLRTRDLLARQRRLLRRRIVVLVRVGLHLDRQRIVRHVRHHLHRDDDHHHDDDRVRLELVVQLGSARPIRTRRFRRTACQSGAVMSFGKVSQPIVTSSGHALPLGRRAHGS